MIVQASLSPLTIEDIPELEPLEDASHLTFWGLENYCRFLQEYPEYFGRKAVLQLVAGRVMVGFLLARTVFENLEILKVGVHPEYRRRGIGSQLMEAACGEGRLRGCNRCFLEVRKSNASALKFYYHHGFEIAGARLNYYTDPVEDALIMQRAF